MFRVGSPGEKAGTDPSLFSLKYARQIPGVKASRNADQSAILSNAFKHLWLHLERNFPCFKEKVDKAEALLRISLDFYFYF